MRAVRIRESQRSIVVALLATTWPIGSVHAEQFLSLPTSSSFPITCRWTCPNPGGGTYYHNATDYGTPTNTEIFAASTGEVSLVEDGLRPGQRVGKKPYGNQVRIRHPNGYETRYAHLLPNTITVRVGDRVEAGQLLGLSDNTGKSTGPHLHFEVRDASGRRVNPYGDPPDYTNGCGPNALWLTCPPTPADSTPPIEDVDGDGYSIAAGDCDDLDPTIYPGGSESCNDLDDDCDGSTDENWRTGLTTDLDEQCEVGIGECANFGFYVCTPDGRTTVCSADPFPSSPELCNGLDENCDDTVDDPWMSGLSTDIGEPCTINWSSGFCAGPMTAGVWRCTPDGLGVVCDAPNPESCNWADDDCNGFVDDIPVEYLWYDARNCGACWSVCPEGQICLQGQCVDADCEYDRCAGYCDAVYCADCDGDGCFADGREDCYAACPGNLPFDSLLLNCLCHGGCVAYIAECR